MKVIEKNILDVTENAVVIRGILTNVTDDDRDMRKVGQQFAEQETSCNLRNIWLACGQETVEGLVHFNYKLFTEALADLKEYLHSINNKYPIYINWGFCTRISDGDWGKMYGIIEHDFDEIIICQ